MRALYPYRGTIAMQRDPGQAVAPSDKQQGAFARPFAPPSACTGTDSVLAWLGRASLPSRGECEEIGLSLRDCATVLRWECVCVLTARATRLLRGMTSSPKPRRRRANHGEDRSAHSRS